MSIFVLALLAGVFGPSLLFRLFHVGGTNNKSVEAILSDFDAAEEAARPAEVSLRPSAQLPKPRPPESAVTDRSATVSTTSKCHGPFGDGQRGRCRRAGYEMTVSPAFGPTA